MEAYQLALAAALLCVLAEMLLPSFVFAGFAVGCVAVAVSNAWRGAWAWGADATLWALVSVGAMVALRRWWARADDEQTTTDNVNRY